MIRGCDNSLYRAVFNIIDLTICWIEHYDMTILYHLTYRTSNPERKRCLKCSSGHLLWKQSLFQFRVHWMSDHLRQLHCDCYLHCSLETNLSYLIYIVAPESTYHSLVAESLTLDTNSALSFLLVSPILSLTLLTFLLLGHSLLKWLFLLHL